MYIFCTAQFICVLRCTVTAVLPVLIITLSLIPKLYQQLHRTLGLLSLLCLH
jgi:hypothetical protein